MRRKYATTKQITRQVSWIEQNIRSIVTDVLDLDEDYPMAPVGCGSFGCAMMTKLTIDGSEKPVVVKLTVDPSEVGAAYNVQAARENDGVEIPGVVRYYSIVPIRTRSSSAPTVLWMIVSDYVEYKMPDREETALIEAVQDIRRLASNLERVTKQYYTEEPDERRAASTAKSYIDGITSHAIKALVNAGYKHLVPYMESVSRISHELIEKAKVFWTDIHPGNWGFRIDRYDPDEIVVFDLGYSAVRAVNKKAGFKRVMIHYDQDKEAVELDINPFLAR
jgi:hypothetical protein